MGIMNDADKRRFIEHLSANARNGCVACGGKALEAVDVVSMPVLERGLPGGLVPGTQMVPCIPVVCQRCGHISLFKAVGFFSER